MSFVRAGSLILGALLFPSPTLAQRGTAAPQCAVVTPLKAVPGLYEGSGLALSRGLPRRLFTMNDSGAAEVLVLNTDGAPRGKVLVSGADVNDWEDVTTGPCAGGSCLYIADIGDNLSVRTRITIYQMPEPADGATRATAVRFDVEYPDGPHDAEAVFAGPDGRLYLLTKEPRGSALYALPNRLTPASVNRLERLAVLDFGTGRGRFARVTDAESSADGRTVAVRTNDTLFVLPTTALLAGRLAEASIYSLRQLGEPKGEGVAPAVDGEVFVLGEGGGRRATGTFAALKCATR
ncbi:MAG: hypothetical protein ABL986_21985 [Vicinamibacterales bacterium]